MKQLSLLGRVLYAVPFAVFGFLHLNNAAQLASPQLAIVPHYLPMPTFWVYLTGICFLLASIAILFNRYSYIASLLLGIMLILFVLMVHVPQWPASLPFILKDTSLAGAAFFIASFARHTRTHVEENEL